MADLMYMTTMTPKQKAMNKCFKDHDYLLKQIFEEYQIYFSSKKHSRLLCDYSPSKMRIGANPIRVIEEDLEIQFSSKESLDTYYFTADHTEEDLNGVIYDVVLEAIRIIDENNTEEDPRTEAKDALRRAFYKYSE